MERLDRAYASPEWLDKYPLSTHLAMLNTFRLCILTIRRSSTKQNRHKLLRRRPYQFENWCLRHPDIPTIIASVWQTPIAGSPMYRFTKHLSLLRQEIKRWCLDHKVVWGIDWKELSAQLTTSAVNMANIHQGNEFMSQRQQMLDKARMAHSYWSQRSKDKYTQDGELSTKFFFNKMKRKQRSTYIYLLKNAEGEWTDDVNVIYDIILNHFKTAYATSSTPIAPDPTHEEAIDLVIREMNLPQFSAVQQQQLLLPFSETEVHEAMFGIGNAKSPGLDGSTPNFFKTHCWDLLGLHVFQAVNRFLTTGFILCEWNQSLIVLLPKGPNPEDVAQFRPISL